MMIIGHFFTPTRHIQARWSVLLLGLILLLNGCARISSHKNATFSTEADWPAHQQTLRQITNYQVNGSFAYISAAKKNYAKFAWQQHSSDAVTLQLNTPWGSRVATLTLEQNGAQFEDDKNRVFDDVDVESLLFRLTQMHLPVSKFKTLLLGLVEDDVPHTLTAQGYLNSAEVLIDDQTWQVQFFDYRPANLQKKSIALPHRIELRYDDTLLKLNLTQWK